MICGGRKQAIVARASAFSATSFASADPAITSILFLEVGRIVKRSLFRASAAALLVLVGVSTAAASEAELVLPDLSQVDFHGMNGRILLMIGLVVSLLGAVFGIITFIKLRNLPVHRSMRNISELIYATCKTYLITQGKFILLLELFIGAVMVIYFGWLREFGGGPRGDDRGVQPGGHRGQLRRRVVRHSDQYVREFAGGIREPAGKPFPVYAIPLQAGISIGTLLICVEL